jgi:large subunit ribosomal protein L30e
MLFEINNEVINMAVDANKEIRRAVDTGKVSFGLKTCQKNLMQGVGELIIVSNNMPLNEKEKLEQLAKTENKRFFVYQDTGLALGSICGKPFVVSAMVILDKGKSKVLEVE